MGMGVMDWILWVLVIVDIFVTFGGWYYVDKKSYDYGPDFNKWKSILTIIAVGLVILIILLVLLIL